MQKGKQIKDWSEEAVNKVFSYHLDGMHPLDSIEIKRTVLSVEDKRSFLIDVENKIKDSFK